MPSYKDHDARKRALATPVASNLPKGISSWCHRIPEEEKALYPIDQSDGGEDEDEFENYQWTESLKSEGRNPSTPWLRQTPALEILDKDYIAAGAQIITTNTYASSRMILESGGVDDQFEEIKVFFKTNNLC